MEFPGRSLLKLALVIQSLFLLAQLPITSASSLLKDLNACGDHLVSYLDDDHSEVFYLNGVVVDRLVFCEALEYYQINHCFIEAEVGQQYCDLKFSLDELRLREGGKLLRRVVREESKEQQVKTQGSKDKDGQGSMLNTENLAMAAPAILILCCGIICPCFRARKRPTDHTVLEKELNSMDSISSMEMGSVHEKIPPSPLRVPPSPSRFSMSPKLDRVGSVHLNMNQVMRATCNFSESLKIGEGGFGTVYKARLPDGQVVAIKRAKKELFESLRTEFKSEVELLAKIDHRNLVKLLGYVDKGNERLIITEYVPNGTLREHLDGVRGKILDFNQRLEISIDVAHALTYLHLYAEKQIIHRDVKSSNILLTESMRAKVADFGFAKLGELDTEKTHFSTKVKGTVGYLDPEYMKTNQLTAKSDVYSFGVLLLEILTGRRPVELKKPPKERITLRWAFRKYNEGSFVEMIDPQMNEIVDREILIKMFGLAIQCAAPIRADRPDMKTVGEQLWGIRMDYVKRGRS